MVGVLCNQQAEMFKAIIFDYNGVLVDDVKIHTESYLQAGRDLGFPLSHETVRKYISYAPDQKRKHYFGNISDEQWCELSRIKAGYYYNMAKNVNIIFSEVEAVLTSLSSKYALALISNTTREQFERTFHRHLARLFRETLFVDDVEEPKPSPEPLLKVMEQLGVGIDQCCYVGDSVLDVRMARKVGIKMFAVPTGDNTLEELRAAGANWVINRLSELNESLEAVR